MPQFDKYDSNSLLMRFDLMNGINASMNLSVKNRSNAETVIIMLLVIFIGEILLAC